MPGSVRTIGQVMKTLKPDFPDLSISKIRFLESEGLLSPERAPSGYRKYSDSDVERLRYILTCQRDHFQPLRVIRDHLEMMDRGEEPPVAEAPPLPSESEGTPVPKTPAGQGIVQTRGPIRMNRRELIRASGITEALLMELERHQLVRPKRGVSYFGQEALVICVAARRLSAYGMDSHSARSSSRAGIQDCRRDDQGDDARPYGDGLRHVGTLVGQLSSANWAALSGERCHAEGSTPRPR